MPPRFEGLPTASSQAVPLDGCFALILSLGGRGKTAAGAPGARSARDGGLIDCEEDRTLRAMLVGMLRESDR